MFKFVNNDARNPTGKRKQSQRACETCRQRKKRCDHDPKSADDASQKSLNGDLPKSLSSVPTDEVHSTFHDQPSTPVIRGRRESPRIIPRPKTGDWAHPITYSDSDLDVTSSSCNPRFIGDLNPESVFLAAASSDTTRDASSSVGVGIWLAQALSHNEGQPACELPGLFNASTSLLPKVLLPVLQEEVLSTLPPPPQLDALSALFFEKMHPILPIIDRTVLHSLPGTDPRHVLLLQGMCLAASKSFSSIHNLVLPGSESPLISAQFGSRVSAAMRLIIEMGLVDDKFILIQALAIMSHFTEGQESGSLASQYMSRAIQHVFSLGLHVPGHRREEVDESSTTLFCCVWALDRINAAFHGRPVTIHERDLGRNLEQCIESQQPVFRLLSEVILILDKIIGLYRPSYNAESSSLEIDFPSFEELVTKCSGSHIATPFLATIEMFYHAVTILSSRSKAWDSPARSSLSFFRQSLASYRVSTTAKSEIREQLVLFPFVPYAFSLSLSIAYREMRYNKLPMGRSRARIQFQHSCDILSELADIFESAAKMAEMGTSTLKEMDRVHSVVAVSEQRKLQPEYDTDTCTRVSTHHNIGQDLGNNVSTTANQSQDVPQKLLGMDQSLLEPASEVDLFSFFDPTFDLDAVDALFWGNLDPSFSS